MHFCVSFLKRLGCSRDHDSDAETGPLPPLLSNIHARLDDLRLSSTHPSSDGEGESRRGVLEELQALAKELARVETTRNYTGDLKLQYCESFLALCGLHQLEGKRKYRQLEEHYDDGALHQPLWVVEELVNPLSIASQRHFSKWMEKPECIFGLVYKIILAEKDGFQQWYVHYQPTWQKK